MRTKGIQQLFDEFIFECEYSRKLKPTTLRNYRNAFGLIVKLTPDLELTNISAITITKFFKTLEQRQRIVGKRMANTGVKKSTVATYWSKLNGFFEWLKVKNHIAANPFSEMAYPTPSYEDKKFLNREEVEKIITAVLKSSQTTLILKRNLLLLYVLLFCGLRKEEFMSLQIRHIDIAKRMLTVRRETSKSDRTRVIPLHNLVLMHLKDYLIERKAYTTQYLFVSSTRDSRLSDNGLKHLVSKLIKVSGVHFHLHQLRHTFAVNFLNTNKNIAKLKQLLGHTSIAMTLQYLRCLPPNEMRADINALDIDSLV